MRVITEAELRDQYKQAEFSSFRLPDDTRLTPSAQQFLSERRISIITGDSGKPENMTHLNGKSLVLKSHPRIKFRGKLDSMEALVISTILEVESHGYVELAKDLGDVLDYLRQVMSAEVRERPLEPLTFHSLNSEEIREHSHYPHRHYGISHFLPQPRHGKLMAQLNMLRVQTRELEVAAMDAFCTQTVMDRPDIIQALNRLSSLFYIMMIQICSGHYKVGSGRSGKVK